VKKVLSVLAALSFAIALNVTAEAKGGGSTGAGGSHAAPAPVSRPAPAPAAHPAPAPPSSVSTGSKSTGVSTGSKPAAGSVANTSTGSHQSGVSTGNRSNPYPNSTVRTSSGYVPAYSFSGGPGYVRSPYGGYVYRQTYFYSDWPLMGGYYGCMYCMTGPYAYGPSLMGYSAPTPVFDLGVLLLLLLIVGGVVLVVRRA
jgi:hypothetical protein